MSSHQKTSDGILAVFQYLDQVTEVVDKISGNADFKNHVVYAPTSYHELLDQAEKNFGASEVRWFTLTGAVTGMATGIGMPLLMDWDWPIVVGGKTAGIPSTPAYMIFVFELMVLFGAIATILGILVMSRLPNPNAKVRDKRTTDDRFAIYVPGVKVDSEQARNLLKWGAEEVYEST